MKKGSVVAYVSTLIPAARGPGAAPHMNSAVNDLSAKLYNHREGPYTRAFSWLKAPTSAFTFKTLLRHYAKREFTPQSLNVKLGPQRNYHKGRAAIRHYANQTACPLLLVGAFSVIVQLHRLIVCNSL